MKLRMCGVGSLWANDRDEEHEGGHNAYEDALHSRVVWYWVRVSCDVRREVFTTS